LKESIKKYWKIGRIVKIPEEKRDYALEVKFKNFKSSSHALDKLMEAIQKLHWKRRSVSTT